MTNQKISLSFARYKDDNILAVSRSILQSMTNNPAFLNPVPPLTDLQAAITAYSNALLAATGMDRGKVAVKKQCRKTLQAILKQLGMYVTYIANGDKTILVSSGFSLTKEPENAYIVNPGTVIIKNGISTGQLVVAVKMVKGANGYAHQITPDPLTNDSQWQTNASNKCRFTFEGLQPGQKYWVRIAALGSGGQIAYSAVGFQYAQ